MILFLIFVGLINASSCSLNYFTQNITLFVGATLSERTGVDKPPTDRAIYFMEQEIWKDVAGYEGLYQVSNFGKIKSLARVVSRNGHGNRITVFEKIMSPHIDDKGYYRPSLNKGAIKKNIRLHRLVAIAFIPNPTNLPGINHKDLNKLNCHVDNLEWCDQRHNMKHAWANGAIDMSKNRNEKCNDSKRVGQYDLLGNLIKIWPSTHEAGRNGFYFSAVAACARGKKHAKTHKGFKWKYL